jgi:phosphopantetheine adenylyltransferase
MHLHEENLSNKLLFFLLNAIMGSGFSGTFVNALIKLRDYLIKVCHYTTLIDNKKERFRYLNRYLESNETYYELALIVTKVTSFTGQTALAATAVDDTATSVVTTSFIEYDDDANNKEHTKNDFFKYFIENFHNLIVEDSKTTSKNETSNNGLPDLINQQKENTNSQIGSNDKARKFLEGLDGVKFNEIQVPDVLKKQLEYFDRDELLQLIAYQKKYLDYKESRIKDLENYIDNLVVKIIETEPLILMNASNVLATKSTKLI